jgi:hypothetical protein
MEFTKSFTAGFFGGEGFVLQKLSGEGHVLVKGGGTIVRRRLAEGEVLRVTSGSLVAFESTVSYEVQMVQGIRNAMFGGEGLFMTTLTGPGTVWLQGMPPDRMIAEIASRVPSGSGLGIGIPIGVPIGGGLGAGEAAAAGAVGQVGAAGAADVAGAGLAGDMANVPSSSSAAVEQAIEADRNAAVATSALDSESPSALFGDAAPTDLSSSSNTISGPAATMTTDSNDETSSFGTEMNEPVFQDDPVAPDVTQDRSFSDGELFNDTSSSSPAAGAGDTSDGGGLLSTLWNIFTGSDD